MEKDYKQLWNDLRRYMLGFEAKCIDKKDKMNFAQFMLGASALTAYQSLQKVMDKMENGVAYCDECGAELKQEGAIICEECEEKRRNNSIFK
ncbi:MAG: hypothetical protein J6S85_01065 [Methanobrevibacter sp.]|nr:hypothetical protein [Methanobrevibacter sp.]MBO7712122.1 hypothetical protein [Methanobrevibacter sp.]